MISRIAFALIVFLLCSCASTSVSSTSDKEKNRPLSEVLPIISGISTVGASTYYGDGSQLTGIGGGTQPGQVSFASTAGISTPFMSVSLTCSSFKGISPALFKGM